MRFEISFIPAILLAAAPLAAFQTVAPEAPPALPRAFAFNGETGYGSKSYLGVGASEITPERAKVLKLPEERGVEITRVDEDSPAAKAGLKAGDVILDYNGEAIGGIEQFIRLVHETPSGRRVKLVVSRGGASQTLVAAIGSRKAQVFRLAPIPAMPEIPAFEIPGAPMPGIPEIFETSASGRLGIEAETLSPQLAEYFGVKEGVLVRSVRKDSPASRAGMKAGDIITMVENKPVASPMDVTGALRAARTKRRFPVTVMRNHRATTLSVTLDADSEGGGTALAAPVGIRRLPE